ncbi:DNA replication and repair protein RecR [Verrucomicrobium sp. GAS474]|uniref:recombination mediator RecR n=1 Tax=Verrucomicrobium sp. GAS474 TaxID=1882831 RepID=UPI00087BE1BC|nr:recombination mediator RecR [Verrucomicrobium sp. GAS474]SDU02401.1 DNA replication and repair protein RecR [Verrucomicrobium sp. GAS474]
MADYPPSFSELIAALRQLPSVGARSAERLALFLVGAGPEVGGRLAAALTQAGRNIVACRECGFYAEREAEEGHGGEEGVLCPICRDGSRDGSLWCLVEQADDVVKFEKAAGGGFRGLYHVLGGKLSPLEGIGPDELRIAPMLARLATRPPKEVILALGTDVEGETTALYLAPLLKARGVAVSRLATGLPAGGGLEFADSVTLGYALAGRREI